MTDKDTIDMIERCVSEITSLRAQLAAAQPKADAYDILAQVLGLLPRASQGYGEDIVWRLRRQIEDLQPKPIATEEEGAPNA